ncbi:MAG: cell division inhibitor SepF [Solirubrobacteraceae bacterium]|nr:cell division inhibitor SepF [Solirubrobacteraceae bacterium]
MAIRNSWRRALVFSGLVDDNPRTNPEYLLRPDPEPVAPPDPPASVPLVPAPIPAPVDPPHALDPPTDDYQDVEDAAERIVVRRMSAPPPAAPPARDDTGELLHRARPSPSSPPAPASPPPPPPRVSARPPHPPRDVSVLRVAPRSFNDAQQVADRFKAATPVVLDLEGIDNDLAKRLIGFASGLTYGLDGGMERLDQRVFLLTPRGVEIPPAQRARLSAQGSLGRA